ncbi:transferrin-binding protein-like solute binding protein [Caulobacter sp. Root1472]|jgi:hypothetical protein|uniref:transferrin-binding protein-like solute binding protein n=1 Tax=Caulobacter sp. Root1472 TaxID=1736470 RepID=UPI0006F75A27|nr:transferrin-binding protein-like solute binding protein [Caulobacter sp. Root1472]KQZ17773.1 hypothetical protein ASD47_11845 [Caulobacter sp. Root1472]
MLRKRSFFVLAAMMAISACASGGGGGVTPPVVPPVTPPPPPYASNCTTTPGAISCVKTGTLQMDGPQIGLRFDSTVSTYTFDNFQIYRKDALPQIAQETWVLGFLGGASVIYKYYADFESKNDGLGPVRVGKSYINDIGGLKPGGTGALTLFDITNVLQGGLDYVQLGEVAPNPVNGAYTFFAVGRTAGTPVMPNTGSARYDGGTRGIYVDGANTTFSTASDVTMTANFGTGAVNGSTSNFKMVNAAGSAVTAPAGLAFTFNGNIAGAKFTGTASNAGMTGNVSGAFYGEPNGAPVEAGLSYNLGSATGGGSMMGVGGLKKN